MKLFLLSNNLLINNLNYLDDFDIDTKRKTRVLSIEGEKQAIVLKDKIKVENVYTSSSASSIGTAKYVAKDKNVSINITNKLNDLKIGDVGKYNISMLKHMQERNFDFKFTNGESISECGKRLDSVIRKIIDIEKTDTLIITHKRAILSFLTINAETNMNLNEELIITYNDELLMNNDKTKYDLFELDIENKKIVNIINRGEFSE